MGPALLANVPSGSATAPVGTGGSVRVDRIVVCDGLLVQWLLDPDAPPSGTELTAALRPALG